MRLVFRVWMYEYVCEFEELYVSYQDNGDGLYR